MAWSITNFQRGGLIGWLLPNSLNGITEITRALDLVGVRMLAQNQYSTGLHALGWDIDVQGGKGNDALHEAVAQYALAHWSRLAIRYMAWGGSEWLTAATGGPDRRPQVKDYGGSDPFHKNHVHISFNPVHLAGVSGARPDIRIGTGLRGGADGGSEGGRTQPATVEAIATENQRRITEVRTLTRTVSADLTRVKDRAEKTNHAVGRLDRSVPELARRTERLEADVARIRDRVELTNHAAGRLDRWVPEILAQVRALGAAVEALAAARDMDAAELQERIDARVDGALETLLAEQAGAWDVPDADARVRAAVAADHGPAGEGPSDSGRPGEDPSDRGRPGEDPSDGARAGADPSDRGRPGEDPSDRGRAGGPTTGPGEPGTGAPGPGGDPAEQDPDDWDADTYVTTDPDA